MAAFELLRKVHDAGLVVPGDISIAGVDDIPSSCLMIPSLTTVRAPIGEMVRQAFLLAVERRLSGDAVETVSLKGELVVRESTSRPPYGRLVVR
jgi:LacI family transcriptional regulator